MTPNKGYGPKLGETAHICEVNRAKMVTSDARVARNKNLDPVQNVFSYGWPGTTVPQLQIFQTSGIVSNESS